MRGDAHYLESTMEPFQPISISEDLIVIKKRDLITSSLAVSRAAELLAELTGNDNSYWITELVGAAREECNSYSKEEVEEFLKSVQQQEGK